MSVKSKFCILLFSTVVLFLSAENALTSSSKTQENPNLDERVRKFLDDHRYSWRDMNVPAVDGRILHDLVIKNNYTKALEIGTSTILSSRIITPKRWRSGHPPDIQGSGSPGR